MAEEDGELLQRCREMTRIREAIGLTQKEFASLVCVTQVTVSSWEQQIRCPSAASFDLAVTGEIVIRELQMRHDKLWKAILLEHGLSVLMGYLCAIIQGEKA